MSHLKARRHLSKVDPKLGTLIERVGPCRWKWDVKAEPFPALAESICYQQLSGKAAATIWKRVCLLWGGALGTPKQVLATPEETLRAAGLSRNKVAALRDLATHAQAGRVPTRRNSEQLTDAELIEALVQVRGIGRWTVEMFLLFSLGRPDVLPIHDYGVQKGFQKTYGKRKLPTPKQLEAYGKKWAPYRSVAAWYLWRAAEQ